MKKLTLAIEELEVTSFVTEKEVDGRGTVAAHGASGLSCPCQTLLCDTVPTRHGTCCTPVV
ncbi:MAG TPA: hypothetical protein VFR81_22145 [Longimicrobium sp.]|nr:hypothetical protein [Longimicrobium sp.]